MHDSLFERNIQALGARNAAVCARLYAARGSSGTYRVTESRTGLPLPAIIDRSGAAHPLHSTFDPKKEARRLIESLADTDGHLAAGFLVFLGLGAGFAVQAALEKTDLYGMVIIEYGINGAAELFGAFDYTAIFADSRVRLLVDPAPREIENAVLSGYLPALAQGIRTLPLRPRTEQDIPRFNAAAAQIRQTIDAVAADYSVQAHFGGRWFSNIIRNLVISESRGTADIAAFARRAEEAAICAAGPSLDAQLPQLAAAQQNRAIFVIAADTSLSALVKSGVQPDAVVSIDCQHISYYHFAGVNCRGIPLFLDLASPPLLESFSDSPFFMAGGHPLALYAARHCKRFPALDTSGGNVTYACLSLAETLGARKIRVYGADFSYPEGRVYARGTYIYPYFERRQNRLTPAESQFAAFLYRAEFLSPENPPSPIQNRYRETATLRLYREKFEAKASAMNADIRAEAGQGAPLAIRRASAHNAAQPKIHEAGGGRQSVGEFLARYTTDIANLPLPARGGAYPYTLGADERQILATLLPLAAALKRRRPELQGGDLLAAVKAHCIAQIEAVTHGVKVAR